MRSATLALSSVTATAAANRPVVLWSPIDTDLSSAYGMPEVANSDALVEKIGGLRKSMSMADMTSFDPPCSRLSVAVEPRL